MKIVHIMNYYMTGMGYQENFLPFCQQKLGHDVYIITSDRDYPSGNYGRGFNDIKDSRQIDEDDHIECGVHIKRLKTKYENVSHALLKFEGSNLNRVLKEIKPEIIHVHDYKNMNVFAAINYAKKSPAKVFIDCHTDYRNNLVNHPWLKKIAFNDLTRYLYNKIIVKNISRFLAITEASEEFLHLSLGVPREKIILNRLGSNTGYFKFSLDKKTAYRQELNYSKKDVVFISTGKMTTEKRYDIILKAFKHLETMHKNVKLILIGSMTDDIKQLTKSINNITYLSFIEHKKLLGYYCAADIAIWPAPSVSIIDSMAAALPFILFDEQITKYLAESKGGLLFETEKEACEAMDKLVKDLDLRKSLSNNAFEYVQNNLSWDRIASESINIYCS